MRNEALNNTCILFDTKDEEQQKAIIKYYNDNGWCERKITFYEKEAGDTCIGIYDGNLGYWRNSTNDMQVIELPKEYYPIEVSLKNLENISKLKLDGNGLIEGNKKEFDPQELWDEFSEHIDDDIDSLQSIAGTTILTKSQFTKIMAKIITLNTTPNEQY